MIRSLFIHILTIWERIGDHHKNCQQHLQRRYYPLLFLKTVHHLFPLTIRILLSFFIPYISCGNAWKEYQKVNESNNHPS